MKFLCSVILALVFATSQAGAVDVQGRVSVQGRPSPGAVVWLDAPNARAPQRGRVVMDQRNLTFIPRVLAVQVGTTVDFPNNDRVFHNVFSIHDGKKFDLGIYPVGGVKHVKFDKLGLSRIFCNIHPNMGAYIMAVDSPYFAVSDRDGRFEIKGAPAGNYSYQAWRPGGSTLNGRVTVGSGANLEVRWP